MVYCEMERSDERRSSDWQRSLNVEMTRRDTEQVLDDDVTMPDTCKSSCDLGDESSHAPESHQTVTVCREPVADFDTPSLACSPTTEQALFVHIKTPGLPSSASSRPGGAGRLPRRILPLTKHSEKMMSSDVTETSAAAAAASVARATLSSPYSHAPTLPHDVKDWFPNICQQPSIIPSCSGILASSFTKSLESATSEMRYLFSSDSATNIDVSVGSVESPTTFKASQSTIALQDVYGLGLLTSCSSSSFSSDEFQAAQEELPRPDRTDFLELEAAKSHSFPQSNLSAHPFQDAEVFRQSASTRYQPELEAAGSGDSSRRSRYHTPPTQSSALPTSELVKPLLSLHIDTDVAGGRRRIPHERRARTTGGESVGCRTGRTHPGCSTLRYNRRHNPGLHRPRTYKCDKPGRSTNIYTVSQKRH